MGLNPAQRQDPNDPERAARGEASAEPRGRYGMAGRLVSPPDGSYGLGRLGSLPDEIQNKLIWLSGTMSALACVAAWAAP